MMKFIGAAFAALFLCTPAYAVTTDTITSNGDLVALGPSIGNRGSVAVQITGTYNATLQFEVTVDNTNWVAVEALPTSGAGVTSTTATGVWTVLTSGYSDFRVRASAYTSGTATVTVITTPAALPGRTAAGSAVTSLIGVTSLGQTTAANSIPVVQASDAAFTVNPTTAGGLSMSKTLSAGSTNATNVKASAGQVYHIEAYSLDATPVYVKLYNTSSAPTCNSDTIVWQQMIPSNSTAANGSGFVVDVSYGLAFSTGISFCLTTGIAANDTGAVTASEVLLVIGYK